MSNTEPTRNTREDSEDGEIYSASLNALNLVQDILMDENPEVDRPDIWTATWEELQQTYEEESTGISTHEAARAQIRSLYMEGLENLYPELALTQTMDEFIMATAMLPEMPPIDGYFSTTTYRAENGNLRAMTFAEARIGDHTTQAMYVSDIETDFMKSYSLKFSPDFTIYGGTSLATRDGEQQEHELLQKVDPAHRNNLLRIMYGKAYPYEVDMMLIEMHTASLGLTPEAELDQIVADAKASYDAVIERQAEEAMNGLYGITMNDLNELHDIIAERIAQLG